MPRKKPKDANEMSDRELLRRVFPEHVIRRVEEELGLKREIPEPESELDFPNKDSL